MTCVRLGAVSYLNARPLVYGLERSAGRFSVRFDVPSVCAALLHSGDIDVGLIPSIEYAGGDYRIAPGAAVASSGPVASVALFSTRPVDAVRTIALDSSSRTSVTLLRVLCADWFHIQPSFETAAPDLEHMLERADAALVIGDVALFAEHERLGLSKIDLGAEWTAMTRLPFVYAFWAGRPGAISSADVDVLTRARAEGEAHVAAIAQEAAPGDEGRQRKIAGYLRDNIRYDLGEAEQAGLRRFFERAAAIGAIGQPSVPRFY
jgi:chorismate dehydratase